jgi:hypothetical protein
MPSLDVTKFAARDQELAWRDLAVATVLTETALEVSTTWSFSVARPRLPALADTVAFKNDPNDRAGSSAGSVVHVLRSSIPRDAIIADQGLYNRDVILHEALARARQVLAGVGSTPLYPEWPGDVAWSQADGAPSDAGVGLDKELNTALFSAPDRNLAHVDNQLAGYVARLVDMILNPFEHATRLLVEVTGEAARPPEVYVLRDADDHSRTWVTAPFLANRCQLTYHRQLKTLSWADELARVWYPAVPAPVALSPTGDARPLAFNVGASQALVRAAKPAPALAGFQAKAARLAFPGKLEQEVVKNFLPLAPHARVASYTLSTPLFEQEDAVLTRAGQQLSVPLDTLAAGDYRVAVWLQPDAVFKVLGARGARNSGNVTLVDGASIVCPANSTTNWSFGLSGGVWLASFEYTTNSPGSFEVTLNGNIMTLAGTAPGEFRLSPQVQIAPSTSQDVTLALVVPNLSVNGSPLTVTVRHFELVGQLAQLTADYELEAELNGVTARASFVGKHRRHDVAVFNFKLSALLNSAHLYFKLKGLNAPLPLRLKAVCAQPVAQVTPTPAAAGFEAWKYAQLKQAVDLLASKFQAALSGALPLELTPPPADNFDSRQLIDVVNRGVLIGATTLFTKELGEPDHGGNAGGKSGWWKWAAKSSGLVTVRPVARVDGATGAGTDFDVLLDAYTGTTLGGLSRVPQVRNDRSGLQFYAQAGVEYQLAIDGVNGAGGAFALEFLTERPSNEQFNHALEVKGFARGVKFAVVTSAWLSWQAPWSGNVKVDATASAFNAVIEVYTGQVESALTPVAQGAGSVEFDAVSNETYKVKLSGSGAAVVDIVPEFLSGQEWTRASTTAWLNFLRYIDPNLDAIARPATAGDIGKPAIVPRGLKFAAGKTTQYLGSCGAAPELAVLQPWMLDTGLLVARREFWTAEAEVEVDDFAPAPEPAPPPPEVANYYHVNTSVQGSGQVTGGGYYLEGTQVTLTATPSADTVSTFKPVDVVFVVDTSTYFNQSGNVNSAFELAGILDIALSSLGIGATAVNRYALVGFNPPSLVRLGTAQTYWGTVSELKSARLTSSSNMLPDGYDALSYLFQTSGLTWRSEAIKLVVVATGPRVKRYLQPSLPYLTRAQLEALLPPTQEAEFLFLLQNISIVAQNNTVAPACRFKYPGAPNNEIELFAYKGEFPYYVLSWLSFMRLDDRSQFDHLAEDYFELARSLGGVVAPIPGFDTYRRVVAGVVADSVASKARTQVPWRFSHWVVDGQERHVGNQLTLTVDHDTEVKAVFVS